MITNAIRIAVFGRDDSRCRFPKCRVLLVEEGPNGNLRPTGCQVAHIYSSKVKGPRYNPDMTQAQIDDTPNLVTLCLVHHKQVDNNPDKWTAKMMRRWQGKNYTPLSAMIRKLVEAA